MGGTLSAVSSTGGEPVVEEVLRVEDLPIRIDWQPPRNRPLERRHRERGCDLLRRRGPLLRRRSWELSAYVFSG